MKKILLTFLAASISYAGFSQTEWEQDSVSVGNRAEKHVFYNVSTGDRYEANANSWHLSFSVQPSQFPNNTLQGTTIRTNNGKRVRVFVAPETIGREDFNTLDTTGMMNTWVEISDSDSSWDVGAFNTGLDLTLPPHLGGPDYGWAFYNSTTKNVESKGKVYVIIQDTTFGFGPNQTTIRKFAKKLYFDALVWDTAFVFSHANLDNSDSVGVEIRKNQFPDRFFVYYNLVTNDIQNLEPAKNQWDVVFTDYYTLAESPGFGPPQLMTVTGTLSKKGTEIWRIEGIDRDSIADKVSSLTELFSKDIRTIGYDWKTHVGQGRYQYDSSLAFVIKPNPYNDLQYLVRFNEFGGVSSGLMKFEVIELERATASLTQTSFTNLKVYPNPVADELTLEMEENATFQLIDLQGKVMIEQPLTFGKNTLYTNALTQGIYFVRIYSNNKVYNQKLLKTN